MLKLEEELKGTDLFAPLPPTEDCPICCVPLSRIDDKSSILVCCGNTICNGFKGERNAARKKQNDINRETGGTHMHVLQSTIPIWFGVDESDRGKGFTNDVSARTMTMKPGEPARLKKKKNDTKLLKRRCEARLFSLRQNQAIVS